jgi:hypothetical protein
VRFLIIHVAAENTGLGLVLANKVWLLLHTTLFFTAKQLLYWNILFWCSSFFTDALFNFNNNCVHIKREEQWPQ